MRATIRPRDRHATERRILDAAVALLVERGYARLGVNQLAQHAGVDKQLIYRYYDGIEGVVAALGSRLDLWVLEDPHVEASVPTTYAALIARLLDAHIVSLRANPLVQQLILWELAAPSAALAALEAARSQAIQAWMGRMKGGLRAPAGIDAPAINALLLAGVHHLVLREPSARRFAGLELGSDAAWQRIRAAAAQLVRLAYPEPPRIRARKSA